MRIPVTFLLLALLVNIVCSNPDVEPLNNKTDKCEQFLHNLTNTKIPASNRSLEENNTLTYSGHNLNDLGNYLICEKLPTQNYNIFQSSTGYLGFCGPSYCSTEQLQNYADNLIQNISNVIRKDLKQYKIHVIDPKITGIEHGFSLVIAVVVIGAVITLAVIGTISANSSVKKSSSKPSSLLEPSPENQAGLREALLANKETVNEVFSKETVNVYVNQEKAVSIPETKPVRKTTIMKIAECFNIKKNIHDLMNFKVDPSHDQNLNVFNGVRALAYGYVVIGHVFMTFMSSKNYAYLNFFKKSKWMLTLIGGTYAVDTFFYLSGFFTGFLLLTKLKKMPFGFSSYTKLIFHRWIRLWPAYLVSILIFWKLAVYYGDGALWFGYVKQAQGCTDSAWQNLLFINNVFIDQGDCFGWGWYLACDFQMFLVAPFICWIYIKNQSRGKVVIWFLFVLSIIYSYYESINTGMTYILAPQMKTNSTEDFWGDYYTNTIVRLSPYMLGLLLGLKFREYKSGKKNLFTDIKEKKINSTFVALSGLALILFLVYYPRGLQLKEDTWSNGFATSWGALGRPLYGLGVFLLTVPSLVGNLPGFRNFFSSVYFTLISRLSYTAYLIHYVILLVLAYDTNQVQGFKEWVEAGMAFSIAVLSCIAAAIIHVFVEKPFVNIEMKFFNKRQPAAIKAKAEK